jgi:hypothetical protein
LIARDGGVDLELVEALVGNTQVAVKGGGKLRNIIGSERPKGVVGHARM